MLIIMQYLRTYFSLNFSQIYFGKVIVQVIKLKLAGDCDELFRILVYFPCQCELLPNTCLCL